MLLKGLFKGGLDCSFCIEERVRGDAHVFLIIINLKTKTHMVEVNYLCFSWKGYRRVHACLPSDRLVNHGGRLSLSASYEDIFSLLNPLLNVDSHNLFDLLDCIVVVCAVSKMKCHFKHQYSLLRKNSLAPNIHLHRIPFNLYET